MGALEGEIRLVGDRLFLREFVSDDCSAVQSYAGDAEVTRFTDWGPNSLDDTRSFLAATAAQSGMPDRREFDLAVVDTRTQDLVGGASLRVTDAEQREGEIGYVIHPAYWSLGYATEAAKLLLEFGFDQLGLREISATCDPENHASARVLNKAGLASIGRVTNHMLVRGAWRDSLLFIATDWRCHGCGVDTDAIDEYFMLHNSIWNQVADVLDGHLCIGCVEVRLGRSLIASDFADAAVNINPLLKRSTRLAARLATGVRHPRES